MDFVSVLRNTTQESQAYGDMEKSCFKVSKSIIAGSDGDEDRVADYMKEVCSEPSSSSAMCNEFASGIDTAMIGDANFNREKLNLNKFCQSFWNGKVQTAAQEKKAQLDSEEKAMAEKKAQEEKEAAEKKAAEDKAAAEKKAADEKAAAEKKAADEAQAAEDAKKKQEADEAATEAKRAQEVKAVEAMRVAAKAKAENLTAAIAKQAQVQEEHYNATEESVSKLLEHAKQAIKLAAKKEAELAEKEKAEKEATAAKAAASKNTTEQNQTASTAVEKMVAMNLTKEEEAAKAAGDAVANKIVAKAEGNKTVSK